MQASSLGNGRVDGAYFDGHPLALLRFFSDAFPVAIFVFYGERDSVGHAGVFLDELFVDYFFLYPSLVFKEKEEKTWIKKYLFSRQSWLFWRGS